MILAEFINAIKLALGTLNSTLDANLNAFPDNYGGHLSVSNISESGYSGLLTKIQIQDSYDGSGNLDATISINVDGAGAQVIALNTMYKRTIVSNSSADNLSNAFDTTASASIGAMTLQLNIPFQTSLVVSISNANGFCIFWHEKV